ncbi:hypothetical protein [Companilactobacillus bobalius]|uniref:Uncharacterized protein n=1 Tax=Companilactobacillus bobalius TaxID=2801451 RepID=A0A202FGB5_9LACO|nr:hypothetical protein [Companilactobacillus bobalius]KAE9557893.1 hypothetical protein ATN92_14995 [Companilactobacillus bobalius]KAE9563022.1 hypothetical protein ATN92_04025 [Companilactobacillus bobalius]OVE99509.1 hypothetical protein LKACC16343_00622 [Companilactobacillus bobalius]GEO59671.1 hypothetical protein LBO01_28000 [Companilactobacillus paralimentarius]
MPPHFMIINTIEDAASAISIVVAIGTALVWVFNRLVIKPLSDSMDRLSSEIKDFKNDSKFEHDEFRRHFEELDDNVHKHDEDIVSIKEQIHTLFKRGNSHEK